MVMHNFFIVFLLHIQFEFKPKPFQWVCWIPARLLTARIDMHTVCEVDCLTVCVCDVVLTSIHAQLAPKPGTRGLSESVSQDLHTFLFSVLVPDFGIALPISVPPEKSVNRIGMNENRLGAILEKKELFHRDLTTGWLAFDEDMVGQCK
jgi:thymidylate kinase